MKKIPLHSLIIILSPLNNNNYEFAKKHFNEYEVLSFNKIKEELVGDLDRHDINKDVSKELARRIKLKLRLGERVVVDSKSIHIKDRQFYGNIGKSFNIPTYYIVHDTEHDIKTEFHQKQESIFKDFESQILMGDGIAEVIDNRIEEFVVTEKLPNQNLESHLKKKGFKGITAIGDVHGMHQSLRSAIKWAISRGHFIIFLGDIIDYGPKPLLCVNEVYDLVMDGQAGLVYGNHERKIDRWIEQSHQSEVRLHLSDASMITVNQIEELNASDRTSFELKYKTLMKFARNHFVIGDFLFTHGAADYEMFNLFGNRLKDRNHMNLAVFGQIDDTIKTREDGYPNRIYDWVNDIPQGKTVIVGHDIRSSTKPLKEAGKQGGEAVFLDTGAGKGGTLSSVDIRYKNKKLEIQNYNKH